MSRTSNQSHKSHKLLIRPNNNTNEWKYAIILQNIWDFN